MIKEQYVSFETAKLLKEKGFDIPVREHYYSSTGRESNVDGIYDDWNNDVSFVSAPTQQMAMRWLRENYNILIYINFNGDINHYCWAMIDLTSGNPKPYEGLAMTYEEAAEEAIKYCLENLI